MPTTFAIGFVYSNPDTLYLIFVFYVFYPKFKFFKLVNSKFSKNSNLIINLFRNIFLIINVGLIPVRNNTAIIYINGNGQPFPCKFPVGITQQIINYILYGSSYESSCKTIIILYIVLFQ